MREKRKSLKLKKHVIARLRTFAIRGGYQTNPCGVQGTGSRPSDDCYTIDDQYQTCGDPCNSNTTTGNKITTPENPCGPQNVGSINDTHKP